MKNPNLFTCDVPVHRRPPNYFKSGVGSYNWDSLLRQLPNTEDESFMRLLVSASQWLYATAV